MIDNETTRPVRDLATALFSPTVYRWNEDYLPPVPGESYYLRCFRSEDNWSELPDSELYLVIPITTWGDYVGGSVERANERALTRDYPETFITLDGDYSSTTLVIPFTSSIDPFLFDALVKLAHVYPLYSEDAHSQIEQDLIMECWEDYAARDFADLIGDDMSSNAELFTRYMAMCEDKGTYPEAETAVSVHFNFNLIVGK